jgi:hypothetical protein
MKLMPEHDILALKPRPLQTARHGVQDLVRPEGFQDEVDRSRLQRLDGGIEMGICGDVAIGGVRESDHLGRLGGCGSPCPALLDRIHAGSDQRPSFIRCSAPISERHRRISTEPHAEGSLGDLETQYPALRASLGDLEIEPVAVIMQAGTPSVRTLISVNR